MPVYIDHVKIPFRGMLMSHMTADTLTELHHMADAIGMKREWFQIPPKASYPHYDVSEPKRDMAIALGAIPVGRRIGIHYAAKLGIEWTNAMEANADREVLLAKYNRSFARTQRYIETQNKNKLLGNV